MDGKKCHPLYKPMEKLLTLGICIKSAVDQKNLKLGVVMITWVISIIQKYIYLLPQQHALRESTF